MTAFIDLIQQFGRLIGHEIDVEDNACVVGTDQIAILLMGIVENQEETLVMTADLGLPPPQHLEKLYEQMMEAMFAHQMTGGGAFGRNPQDGHIWLQRLEPLAGITDEMLLNRLSTLADAAAKWKSLIEDFREAAATPEAAERTEASGWQNTFLQV